MFLCGVGVCDTATRFSFYLYCTLLVHTRNSNSLDNGLFVLSLQLTKTTNRNLPLDLQKISIHIDMAYCAILTSKSKLKQSDPFSH